MKRDKERRIKGRWNDDSIGFMKMRRHTTPRVDPIVQPLNKSDRVIGIWRLRRDTHPRLLRMARESLFGFLRKRGLDGHSCKAALVSASFLRVIRLTNTGCIFGWDDPHVPGRQVWLRVRERDRPTRMVDDWQATLNGSRRRRRKRLRKDRDQRAA